MERSRVILFWAAWHPYSVPEFSPELVGRLGVGAVGGAVAMATEPVVRVPGALCASGRGAAKSYQRSGSETPMAVMLEMVSWGLHIPLQSVVSRTREGGSSNEVETMAFGP